MTIWKLSFGTFKDTILISSKEEAERVVQIIKEFHEHPKVKAGEVYSYCLKIAGQSFYLAKDVAVLAKIEEVEVLDVVPVVALSRKEVEIGLHPIP